jgi:transmembrane sensor
MSPAEFKILLNRYFHGECTPEEVAFIEKWYENIEANESTPESELDQVKQRIWASVRPARKLNTLPRIMKVAAAVTLLVGVAATFVLLALQKDEVASIAHLSVNENDQHFIETKNNSNASHRISLPDGSIVTLDPKSSIRYPENFAPNERVIELSGAAFFNVKRDASRPFLVYSDEIVTKVLGTSFRITAFDDSEEIVVAVKTGKVSVSQKQESKGSVPMEDVILTPNQKLVYKRSEEMLVKQVVTAPSIVSVDSSHYFQMQFDGMPVTEIFDALEKNYGIDIQYDPEILKACVLTTKMTEEGFHERIDIICKAINAEHMNIDGAVRITSKGCQ